VAEVVAGRVLAMLHEFDGMTEDRAFVQTGKEAFDNLAGAEVEPADLGDRFGMQKATGVILFERHGQPRNTTGDVQ
jgi:hypothetical protein